MRGECAPLSCVSNQHMVLADILSPYIPRPRPLYYTSIAYEFALNFSSYIRATPLVVLACPLDEVTYINLTKFSVVWYANCVVYEHLHSSSNVAWSGGLVTSPCPMLVCSDGMVNVVLKSV